MGCSLTPTVGKVYAATLVPGYTVFNGIYHIAQILTFQEVVQSNVDLLALFFTPAGKTETDYLNDIGRIREDKIFKCLNPTTLDTATAVYIPSYYLANELNPNVDQYHTLGLTLGIGIHKDPEQLSYILDAIQQQLAAALGITDLPKVRVIGQTYLTTDEYDAIDRERKANASAYVNYFSENKRLVAEVAQYRARIQALEEVLINHTPPTVNSEEG